MLENEPDTNDSTAPPAETAPPVRRRRAASRPAGPPSSAPAAPPVQTLDIEVPTAAAAPDEPVAQPAAEPAAEVEPVAPPAKKTARRTSKKAAATPTSEGETTEPAPAAARAPRKRATRKAAAPEPAETLPVEPQTAELLAEAAPAVSAPASVEFSAAEPSEPVEPAPPLAEAPHDIASALAALAEQQSAEVVEAIEEPVTDEPVTDEARADETDTSETDTSETDTSETDTSETDTSETEDADPSAAESDDENDDDSGEGDGRRRRRRRGGRRRRRTGGDEDGSDTDEQPEATGSDTASVSEPDEKSASSESTDGSDAEDDSGSGDGDGDGDGSRRRRRRRRRRGEDAGSSADDPGEVVVRVREPRRQAKQPSNEVTGIEGSTRMEAKRQRRREGREAGRRRTPILSEAEFLARREAVARKMIIRQRDDLAQIAVIEDEILVEHYVDRDSATSLIGNVYLGRVQNVLPSMEAAFIDIGRGRNAVLYAGEVDWDSFGAEGQGRKVERVLKSGQTILVQVTKDPVGAKGARLTNNVSIPGRYIVYAPGGHLSGISRKLPENERKRLKDILADLVGESASVIVRTAAEGASEEELIRDVNRLKAQWEDIERKVSAGQAPQLLYGEPDLTVRIVRDLFTEDFAELIIAGHGGAADAYDAVEAYVGHVAPHLADRLRRWDPEADGDVFAAYRLDEQIAKGLERKVFLPSGGSLVIDRTEAMTVIDVNTGKFTGAGGNLEATVTSNNLEAAEEIVRQLRLRDIGGIIVIDFIDMVLPSNRELLLRRLVECLGRDRTRHQVAEITSLGLVQMTRKKIGTGLLEAFTSECPHCHGRGVELHELPVDSQKQADGGAREPRSRDRRGPAPIPKPQPPANGHGPVVESSSETPNGEVGDNDRDKPSRNRRGGRGRRGSGNDSTDEAPEPTTAEPDNVEPSDAEPSDAEPTDAEPTTEPAPPAEVAPAEDPVGEPVPVS